MFFYTSDIDIDTFHVGDEKLQAKLSCDCECWFLLKTFLFYPRAADKLVAVMIFTLFYDSAPIKHIVIILNLSVRMHESMFLLRLAYLCFLVCSSISYEFPGATVSFSF